MNKQKLASKIWQSANKMRSKIEANEYKDYILGFIFYKFLSDKEVKHLKSKDYTEEDIRNLTEEDEDKGSIQNSIGYFIAYNDLFSTWIEKGSDFSVSDVRDALSRFNRLISNAHKKVFNGIFETLQTGLSKLGDTTGSQTKSIRDLLQLIKDIPMDGKQDYDVLGFIYEYLISNFAANAGKKAGEFYTPHEVSLLMSEIVADHLKDRESIKIYDPTSGSGSLLINIGRSIAKHVDNGNNIKYFAQELKGNTYNLTRMNLVMRNILPDNIVVRNGDTLEQDWPYFDENDPAGTYDPLYVDAVVSNPPYSQAWDPANKEADGRFKSFGLAPKTKADFAFLLHDLFHLKPDGIMTIVLPHGVLFRGDANGEDGEGKIRKNLIEKNHIDTIIGLPSNVFFGTGIATIIMVLRQKRTNDDVLFIDASKGFAKVGKNNVLRASDIKKIADTVICRADVPKFSRKISREMIRENDYNLNIPRYVDSSDTAETWDIYASMFGGIPKTELEELSDDWNAFPGLKSALFHDKGTPFVELATSDIKQTISENADIQNYYKLFQSAFDGFDRYLKQRLIVQMETLNLSKEEEIISEDMFSRLSTVPLVDKYKAYQSLDDEWAKTAVDLEIIQTEGFSATKQVDPNMVIKIKDGKETEVQDGWVGHVIPFALVQESQLKEETDRLKTKENRISAVSAEIAEILESLSEEDKEEKTDLLNEANDAFSAAKLAAYVKKLKGEPEAIDVTLTSANALLAEEKKLKAEVKKEAAALHAKTKETIENLSDEEALKLLERKWIGPLVSAMNELPQVVIKDLGAKVKALADKYAVTYEEVATQITETENSLAALIDGLTGNDFDMEGLREFQKLLKGE